MGDYRDTICALSTAPGSAGIAVVRISGPESFALVRGVFVPRFQRDESLPARYAVLGSIRDPKTGSELDQVLVTCFPAPHSYTGEDLAEVSLHGSPVLVTALLENLCGRGARLAEPGEFTLRAFLSGRMDLSQAEAVRDIIEAKTLYQAQVAARQRSGEIARQLKPLKEQLIEIIVQLESAVEFVEEDLALESRELIASKLGNVSKELAGWIQSFQRGRLVRDGFSLAIVGRPNVGKSSLFNSLLAQDRSIVTEMPGTTRDLISETTHLEGIPLRLLDTAGVRGSEDRIEQLGVDRSFRAMSDADALLLVLDGSQPPQPEDHTVKQRLRDLSCIVVLNKSDLSPAWSESEKEDYAGEWPLVEVSARTGAQVDDLRKVILSRLFGAEGPQRDGLLVTNLRHCQCLQEAEAALKRASAALRQNLSEEFALVDLHAGLKKLGEITGETTVEDLLGEIFSRFCVGK